MPRTLPLLFVLAGCGIVAPETCESNEQCVDAFGFGHTCAPSGQCDAVQPSAACAGGYPTDLWTNRSAYRDAIVLGAIVDTVEFPTELDSIHLAVDQINELGGLDGRSVALIECDPSGTADADRESLLQDAASLLNAGVGAPVVLGPVRSTDAQIVATAAPDLVIVSPGASAISLGGVGSGVWRTVPSDTDLSQAYVRDMLDEGLQKAAIVYARDLGEIELSEQLLADLELGGLSGELFSFDSATERDAQLVEAAYSDADAVLLLSESSDDYVDALLAASAIDEFQGLTLYLGPAAYTQRLFTEAASASALFPTVRGVRSATRQGAVADVFRASFTSAYAGQDPDQATYAGQAYDSAWASFSAMLWGGLRYGTFDADGVSEGLGNLSFGTPVSLGPAGWDELTQEFTAASTVDLDGASSPLDFDASTQAIRGPVAVWVIESGDFSTAREYAF